MFTKSTMTGFEYSLAATITENLQEHQQSETWLKACAGFFVRQRVGVGVRTARAEDVYGGLAYVSPGTQEVRGIYNKRKLTSTALSSSPSPSGLKTSIRRA